MSATVLGLAIFLLGVLFGVGCVLAVVGWRAGRYTATIIQSLEREGAITVNRKHA